MRNLRGQRFGRLVVIALAHPDDWPLNARGHKVRSWLCQCECKTVTRPIPTGNLIGGITKSCGCLLVETGKLVSHRYSRANGLLRRSRDTRGRFTH